MIFKRQPGSAEPRQVRIAFGDDPKTKMSLVWQTVDDTETHLVLYGTTRRLGNRAFGRRVRYAQETGVIHEVRLIGLKPGTTYYYQVGDRIGGMSQTFSFRTAPDRTDRFTFTAFGDHGIKAESRRNVENAIREAPAFHLMLGDLSYANGNQPIWDRYFEMLEPMAANIPTMVALGNHENERIGEERIGYMASLARLAMPGDETRYAFDYGTARFVAFNSDDYRNEEQLKWLDETLDRAKRDRRVRWIIVFDHHPPYGSTERRGNNAGLIERVVPLIDKHRVDLFLSGHDHVYERMYPLRGGEITQKGPERFRAGDGTVYAIQGGGGQSLYNFMPEQPTVAAVRHRGYGYLRCEVTPSRITVDARGLAGEPIDRFFIDR